MELIYIKRSGVWKGLSTDLTYDSKLGKKLLEPHSYGGVKKFSTQDHYYEMSEDAYIKAQRDCFKFFYRITSKNLSLGKNDIIKDRTIACNLMIMKYDLKSPETGSLVLRDASPYMAKLMYSEGNILPDQYEKDIFEYARKFFRHVTMMRNSGNTLMMDTDDRTIKNIILGICPFALPSMNSLRRYDKYAVKQLHKAGMEYDDICEEVASHSLMPVCLGSYTGFNEYVEKIVAETIFEYEYPKRIESSWAKEVNRYIKATWMTDPELKDGVPIPCRIVGRKNEKICVLASDADAEFDLPYSPDGIYNVDQSWLMVLTRDDSDKKHIKEAGLDACTLI